MKIRLLPINSQPHGVLRRRIRSGYAGHEGQQFLRDMNLHLAFNQPKFLVGASSLECEGTTGDVACFPSDLTWRILTGSSLLDAVGL